MKTLEKIKDPISFEMSLFEGEFRKTMATKVALLNRITYYIVGRKGKQMRPMLTFLCAKMINPETSHKTYRAASVIELIHTATLVHDDVVDQSMQRRNFFSINALWKNKIAVLVGDYLLSKGLLLSIKNKDFDILELISRCVEQMSEGELLQLEKARKLNISEEVYYDIIRKKTASLISVCCAAGACAAGASEEVINKFYTLGETIGIAFQIKDDLFDYSDGKIGKPTGIDIKEKKLTLPLIYTINNCSKEERKWVIKSIKRKNNDTKRVKEIIKFVKKKGGLEYAISKMNEMKDKAIYLLNEFPDSNYKESLGLMINYVIDRKI